MAATIAQALPSAEIAVVFDADEEGAQKGPALAATLAETTGNSARTIKIPKRRKDIADLAALDNDARELLLRAAGIQP